LIAEEKYHSPLESIRIAEFRFKKPYLKCVEIEVISLAGMILLMKYAYNSGFRSIKFTIHYGLIHTNNERADFTAGNAILVKADNAEVPPLRVYNEILKQVCEKAEK